MLVWGMKFRLGEIIWGLIFQCPQKLITSLKISGGQKEELIIWGLEKVGLITLGSEKIV